MTKQEAIEKARKIRAENYEKLGCPCLSCVLPQQQLYGIPEEHHDAVLDDLADWYVKNDIHDLGEKDYPEKVRDPENRKQWSRESQDERWDPDKEEWRQEMRDGNQ